MAGSIIGLSVVGCFQVTCHWMTIVVSVVVCGDGGVTLITRCCRDNKVRNFVLGEYLLNKWSDCGAIICEYIVRD